MHPQQVETHPHHDNGNGRNGNRNGNGNEHMRGAYDVPMAAPDYVPLDEATNLAYAEKARALRLEREAAGEGRGLAPAMPRRERGNPLRHGLFARDLVFPEQGDLRAMRRLRRELRREFAPGTQHEEILVEQMASALWRMKQALRAEKKTGEPLSSRAQSAVGALDRQYHRAAHALSRAREVRAANFHAHVRNDVNYLKWRVEKLAKHVER